MPLNPWGYRVPFLPVKVSDSMKFHVRIKPYDKSKGHLRRRHIDGTSHQLFREDMGWYRNVQPDVAARLKTVRNRQEDPSSPLVFDVLSEEEAKALYEAEQAARDRAGRRTPHSAQEPERTSPMRRHDLGAEREARLAASPDLTTRDVRPSSEKTAPTPAPETKPEIVGDLGAPKVGQVRRKTRS